MKAVTWQGKRDVQVEEVPDPTIQEPTDAIIRVTSSAVKYTLPTAAPGDAFKPLANTS